VSGEALAGSAVAVAVGVGIAAAWWSEISAAVHRGASERLARRRSKLAEGAAIEAGLEDPAFEPDRLRESAREIVDLAAAIWNGRSLDVDARPDAALIDLWARSHAAWLGDGLSLVDKPTFSFLRVVNREGEGEDMVDLRVQLRVHRDRPASVRPDLPRPLGEPHRVTLDERWTLGHADGVWLLLSADGDPLTGPVLTDPLIPAAWADDERTRERSLIELAHRDVAPSAASPPELVPAYLSPYGALLDLSAVDARFLPALLAASLAHIVDAWEQAAAGREQALVAAAESDAVSALLYPTPACRLAFRDAALSDWELLAFDPSSRPPSVTVRLHVNAVRYLADRSTHAHVAGATYVAHAIPLTWVLALVDPAESSQWRLLATTNPAAEIPGALP